MTTATHRKTPEIPKRHWRDSDALALRVLYPEFLKPTFGQDRWDLRCMEHRPNKSPPILIFDLFEGDRALTAKELIAARLTKPQAPSRKGVVNISYKFGTLADILVGLRKIYAFMDDQDIARLTDLIQTNLNTFLRSLQDAKMAKLQQAQTVKVFIWLWESREFLSSDGLQFDPWPGKYPNEIVGYKQPEETQTARIPEAVMNGLLTWALVYIDHFSTDIIEAVRLLNQPRTIDIDPQLTTEEKVNTYLGRLRAGPSPVPGNRTKTGKVKPAYHEIAAQIGVHPRVFHHGWGRNALHKAAKDLGLEEYRPGLVTYVPEGCSRPWRSAMTPWEIAEECRNLVLAAYIVCAGLSGMRDSEVQALKFGCLEVVKDEHRKIVRYRLHGEAIKKKVKPEKRIWVVIEPVARAIRVLEALREVRGDSDGLLFVNKHLRHKEGAPVNQWINALLRKFMRHCSEDLAPGLDYGATEKGSDGDGGAPPARLAPMPEVPVGPEGELGPWHLTTSQFRKTLAWFIGNRPMGLAAGMIQYGHASLQMFEGYAGSSASGFRQEVETENLLARVGDLCEIYEDSRRGIYVAGPMARELEAEFDLIEKQRGDFQGRVVDDSELRKLLNHRASKMRIGALADCLFEPSRARCLEHLAPDARHEPVAGLCDPRCPQACWTKRHISPWERTRDEAAAYAKRNYRMSPVQRDILQRLVELAEKVLQEIKEAQNGRKP